MNTTAFDEYKRWLSSDSLSDKTKAELRSIEGADDEIEARFGSDLQFGTAGLRGVMQAGTNNMNEFTVRRATGGLAAYIKAHSKDAAARGVVIACDTRINSELFAKESARVLADAGIKVYIFDGPRPTPELSYAIRELGCIAGINVTASHNPKEYNGYKAYWEDGAQLAPEQASAVSEFISKTDVLKSAPETDFESFVASSKIVIVGSELDEKYMNRVLAERVDRDIIPSQKDMSVVYTPLHGTGRIIVPEVLRRAGMRNVICVESQMIPDGTFPTVKSPNPDNLSTFECAIKTAKEHGCELIIATDPDADRMGVVTFDGSDYSILTGNQVGALLLDYIITAYKNGSGLPDDAYAVKSIVSTELASRICEANGVKMFNVLTGFKFIGEVIKHHEEEGRGTYLLGFEESCGYLKGTYARDKDSVVASMLTCEMAAYYRARGMRLSDAMEEIYKKYGYSYEKVDSIVITGLSAQKRMADTMASLRANIPDRIGGINVSVVRDYLDGTVKRLADGEISATGLPSSNVLYFELEDGSTIVVRPSGTEPKIKVYYMIAAKDRESAAKKFELCEKFGKSLA